MSTELATRRAGELEVGAQVQTERAIAEVQAAMTIAKRFPRDEEMAIERIKKACSRRKLAEAAIYSYPRGGSRIEGASIRLAEVMAQCWGNLDFGVVELEQRNKESTVMAYCHDLETNTRQIKTFTVPHTRDKKGGRELLTDGRDIYEMVANQGARRLRACILGVIPQDIQEEALEACNATLAGDKTTPLIDRILKCSEAFAALGVDQAMLEGRLGHKLSATSEAELVSLIKIYRSLSDEMSKREDWFAVSPKAAPTKASPSQRKRAQGKESAKKEEVNPEPRPEEEKPSVRFTFPDKEFESDGPTCGTPIEIKALRDRYLARCDNDDAREYVNNWCDIWVMDLQEAEQNKPR